MIFFLLAKSPLSQTWIIAITARWIKFIALHRVHKCISNFIYAPHYFIFITIFFNRIIYIILCNFRNRFAFLRLKLSSALSHVTKLIVTTDKKKIIFFDEQLYLNNINDTLKSATNRFDHFTRGPWWNELRVALPLGTFWLFATRNKTLA